MSPPRGSVRCLAPMGSFSHVDGPIHVSGGQGIRIAGAVGPGGPEPTLEWLEPDADEGLFAALTVRLGSESSAEKLLVAVLCALKRWLDRGTTEALLAKLPFPVRETVRTCEQHLLTPVGRLEGREDLVSAVARMDERQPAQAECYIRAVFAAAKESLPPELAEQIAERLPPDVAELWRGAR